MQLTDRVAEQVAAQMRRDGYSTCTAESVWEVYRSGSAAESVIGDDYDEALASRILQSFDEYGVEAL